MKEIIKRIELLFSPKQYEPIDYDDGEKTEEFWRGVECAREVYYNRVMEILNSPNKTSTENKK